MFSPCFSMLDLWYDAMLEIVCAGQAALVRESESAELLIDICASFDRATHSGHLFMLRDVVVCGVF